MGSASGGNFGLHVEVYKEGLIDTFSLQNTNYAHRLRCPLSPLTKKTPLNNPTTMSPQGYLCVHALSGRRRRALKASASCTICAAGGSFPRLPSLFPPQNNTRKPTCASMTLSGKRRRALKRSASRTVCAGEWMSVCSQ